jgi:hypothetical protein
MGFVTKLSSIAAILLCACNECHGEHWGYPISGGTKQYEVHVSESSPAGIPIDGDVDPVLLDKLTTYVEECLNQPIDRRSFVVKIPTNWHKSCDGSQQVLDSEAPQSGCAAKGLEPNPECPCRWRALIQCPNVIVSTPNLYIYQDALIRFVTGSTNPWADERLAKCAQPIVQP